MADFVAAYGFPPGLALDYDTFVGLWLNIGRVRSQKAWTISQGIGLATSKDAVDAHWFDAIDLNGEGLKVQWDVNAARHERRLMDRLGW